MAPNSTFAEDLARLTERERAELGTRPDMEDLAALHDGALATEDADRVREWLSVDPELAATFLELRRSPEPSAPAFYADTDTAWRELSAKLGPSPPASDSPSADRSTGRAPSATEYDTVTPLAPVVRALLALAALVLVGLGFGWWQARQTALPAGPYTRFVVTGEVYRGLTVTVPAEKVGIEFEIALASPDSDGELAIELLDASGRTIRARAMPFGAEQKQVVFKVAKSDLLDGATYQLKAGDPSRTADRPTIFSVQLE